VVVPKASAVPAGGKPDAVGALGGAFTRGRRPLTRVLARGVRDRACPGRRRPAQPLMARTRRPALIRTGSRSGAGGHCERTRP
jgi:hypothetical protein